MKKYKFKTAQYDAETAESDTFQQLLERCTRTALKLQILGVEKDDIICLCTFNHLNSCVPLVAGLFLGNKVCSLDPTQSQLDISHLVSIVKPRYFFVVSKALHLIKNAVQELELNSTIVVFDPDPEDEACTSFEEFLEPQEDEDQFQPYKSEDEYETAIIFFSSGTTGLPKGVCQNHHALLSQAVNTFMLLYDNSSLEELSSYDFKESSIFLLYSSLYWISAVVFMIMSFISGSARVMAKRFEADSFWEYISYFKVELAFLAPIQVIDICHNGRPDNIDTSSLKIVLTGGAAMTEKQIKDLKEILPGTFVSQAYGQTEVAGILTMFDVCSVKDRLLLHYKSESCGRPTPGLSYKVLDLKDGTICGYNEKGELRIKTEYIMNGYFEQNSEEAFDEEGWLKTGDVVFFDEDFCFYVVDRIKEMLKFQSWHVAPGMLEKILYTHPAVKRAVVIGIPHEEDGEHPMAIIITKEGKSVLAEEIESFIEEQVDDRQRLRAGVKFLEEEALPLTPSGKIRRKELRDLILHNKL